MFFKKYKKILIISGMFVLLVASAVLNYFLTVQNEKIADASLNVTNASFFASYRTRRDSTRAEELAYLNAIIDTTADEYSEARTQAMSDKLKTVSVMEKELAVEGLIAAKGFEEAVVAIGIYSDDINVIIKNNGFTQNDAAVIYNIVYEELGALPDNVKIIPLS